MSLSTPSPYSTLSPPLPLPYTDWIIRDCKAERISVLLTLTQPSNLNFTRQKLVPPPYSTSIKLNATQTLEIEDDRLAV